MLFQLQFFQRLFGGSLLSLTTAEPVPTTGSLRPLTWQWIVNSDRALRHVPGLPDKSAAADGTLQIFLQARFRIFLFIAWANSSKRV